jgi:hypothetical protein
VLILSTMHMMLLAKTWRELPRMRLTGRWVNRGIWIENCRVSGSLLEEVAPKGVNEEPRAVLVVAVEPGPWL